MPSGLAAARIKGNFLVHKYDRRMLVPPEQNQTGAWGEAIPAYQAVERDQPCLFVDREENVTNAQGQLIERTATIYVAGDDPIDSGDELTNIRAIDERGVSVVLLPGPIDAHYVSGVAPNGVTVYKQVYIHALTAEP